MIPRNANRLFKIYSPNTICYPRLYHKNVIDHFENPRNVGSFDKNDPNVGTGLVGAPACIHEDTIIAIADGRRNISIKTLYNEDKIIQVWSYNTNNNIYEIKNAKVIKQNYKKKMKKVIFDDGSCLICTSDHKFLLKNNTYLESISIKKNESIVPFKRTTTKRGYWEIRNSKNRFEYIEIFKFHNQDKDLKGHNIHHIDFSKTNDNINNLQYLTIKDHIKIHPPRKWTINKEIQTTITKDEIIFAINKNNCRCETADMLDITHKELYELLEYYNLQNKCKRKLSEDIKSEISERMKINNPYFKFTEKQKINFATHIGNKNGRFITITNDELLKIGKYLIEENGKLTSLMWINNAKKHPNKIPQNIHCIKTRFNINSWSKFVEQCNDYNHKIKYIEDLDEEFDCYDLQVEENNNFAVITKETNNIHSGIIIKNCGDVLKLQIKVNPETMVIEDSCFKTFGCGSAISASSYGSEYIKGQHLDQASNISNREISNHLNLPPVKNHCSILMEDAVKTAIADYKNKSQ